MSAVFWATRSTPGVGCAAARAAQERSAAVKPASGAGRGHGDYRITYLIVPQNYIMPIYAALGGRQKSGASLDTLRGYLRRDRPRGHGVPVKNAVALAALTAPRRTQTEQARAKHHERSGFGKNRPSIPVISRHHPRRLRRLFQWGLQRIAVGNVRREIGGEPRC